MNKLWAWFKSKFGRIITTVGFALQGVETIDITPIKDPLENVIGHIGVSVAVIACFVLSFVRHQYVASKVAPKPDILPPPVTK